MALLLEQILKKLLVAKAKFFFAKLTIAYKEARETHYWIRLLTVTNYLTKGQSESIQTDAEELLKIIGSIQKTMKIKLNYECGKTNYEKKTKCKPFNL